ncbi:hypothetical protein AVEN_153193-1 [Araneus ventricosus]|uniref:Uncharacterized protein n=1 Tax=Araneus ventricosus TaxID=182803 RepID=A0A4Y2PJY9_ARAVE|nr:hypothetical protein AVEN_153193-1 [Araneus ventricosus]
MGMQRLVVAQGDLGCLDRSGEMSVNVRTSKVSDDGESRIRVWKGIGGGCSPIAPWIRHWSATHVRRPQYSSIGLLYIVGVSWNSATGRKTEAAVAVGRKTEAAVAIGRKTEAAVA